MYYFAAGIAVIMTIYSLISGEVITRYGSRARTISRQLQPRKYWFYIVIQVVLAIGFFLFGAGIILPGTQ